ncbi:MAG: hypothetical protein OEM01_10820 [Desulfobulbaceae bacterium]|nr:hypothetical protein [Desulfobulbaceae bacterium]
MTFPVRHLKPGESGLPIGIYVFSRDRVWANYEAIRADIFITSWLPCRCLICGFIRVPQGMIFIC